MDPDDRTTRRFRTVLASTGAALAGGVVLALLVAGAVWYVNLVRASHYASQGHDALLRGDNDEALRLHLEAVRLNGREHWIWFNLGVTYSRLDRFDEAVAAYERAADLAPRHRASLAALAETRAYLAVEDGDYERGERLYREAIQHERLNPSAWHGLGAALHRLKRFDDAIDAYRTALRLDPGNAEIEFDLGAAKNALAYEAFMEQDFERSATLYREALIHMPEHSDTWFSLSTALIAIERYDEAREAVAKALQFDPENEDCLEMIEWLDDLE